MKIAKHEVKALITLLKTIELLKYEEIIGDCSGWSDCLRLHIKI